MYGCLKFHSNPLMTLPAASGGIASGSVSVGGVTPAGVDTWLLLQAGGEQRICSSAPP
jgi:hypothetical protein